MAQISVEVSIDEGVVESTCSDLFGGNNPLFQVNIENEGWETYPSFLGLCYNNTPNLQYRKSFICPADVLNTIEICFKVYDEDGIPCLLTTEDCSETVCENFAVSDFGTSVSDSIVISGNTFLSTGNLVFTITTSPTEFATNEAPCNAIDLGVLPVLGTLGNASVSNYNNICANGFDEPNPATETGWNNNQGVWFKFTTSDNPSAIINILAMDDPSNIGDDINLQLALYNTTNDQCDGIFTLVDSKFNGLTSDEVFNLNCLEPNKTYFLVVDGATDFPSGVEGWFGLQISDKEVVAGADLICDAENMGAIPDGGMITTGLTQTNACATATADPNTINFYAQKSVWYQFVAPPSGNVIIEGFSDQELPDGLGAIDIQIALFQTSNNLCTGNLTEINSTWIAGDFDEALSANCLNPGVTYWVLVDGSGLDFFGVFELKITDTGFNPLRQIDTTICAGFVLEIENISITTSGPFIDTIVELGTGCLIPIEGTLNFYTAVEVSINQVTVATEIGVADGILNASTTGGAENYSYLWSDGQTNHMATNLIGGDTYCVTVTDEADCQDEACFEVDYLIPLMVDLESDAISCFGGNDGSIRIAVTVGDPTFDLLFEATSNPIYNGTERLQMLGDIAQFTGLPADTYTITVSNANFSEVFEVVLSEPEPFIGTINVVNPISCFGKCDATVEIVFSGGTAPLPQTYRVNNLCAGSYTENFVDGNDCPLTVNYDIVAPVQVFVTTTNLKNVSCFGAADGAATIVVTPPVDVLSFLSDNGNTTQTPNNLTAGTHNFTIIDINGCSWTNTTVIEGPDSPLTLIAANQSGIVCNGDQDGMIEIIAAGGYGENTYLWSDGQQGRIAGGLSPGMFELAITDAGGCTISETITVSEPDSITAEIIVEDGKCNENGGLNGGAISITNVAGGVAPYQFALISENYSDNNTFTDLAEGPIVVSLLDDLGCVQYYDADITGPDSVSVEANEGFVVFEGDPIVLSAISDNNNISYQWSPADNLECPTCATTNASQVGQVTYTVVATDTTTNCQGVDQVVIGTTDEPLLYIPNIFSPNSDGQNDKLTVFTGAGVAEILNFEIFTRWGELVFGRQNGVDITQSGWDGNFQGQRCNPGVYPYSAEILLKNGITQYFTGTITLLR